MLSSSDAGAGLLFVSFALFLPRWLCFRARNRFVVALLFVVCPRLFLLPLNEKRVQAHVGKKKIDTGRRKRGTCTPYSTLDATHAVCKPKQSLAAKKPMCADGCSPLKFTQTKKNIDLLQFHWVLSRI
jgi:hypothetical protein